MDTNITFKKWVVDKNSIKNVVGDFDLKNSNIETEKTTKQTKNQKKFEKPSLIKLFK